ncbi:C2 domain-containing protein At1g53590 isoform X2 [Physcomitrium patens]|uniref:C2 domain-containing protein At1g53590 isoform X2 n=1 Tax=Physcomitrium patens TaxID=3218 RepID=UPI003CCD246D
MDNGVKKNRWVLPWLEMGRRLWEYLLDWPFMCHIGLVLLVAWIVSFVGLNVALVCALGFLYLYQIEHRQRRRLNWRIRYEEREKANKTRIAEGETVHWMNQILEKTWPIFLKDITSILLVPLTSMLDQFKPWIAKKVIVQNLTLGNTPPRITMIRILDTPVDGDDLCQAIEASMEWMAAKDMSAVVDVKPLRRLGWGMSATFHLCNLRFEGKAKVGVKLKAGWPMIERIRICFGTAPLIDMAARPISNSSFDVTELPGISQFTDRLLADVLTRSLVEPSMVEIDMEKLMRDVMRPKGPAGDDWCTIRDNSPKTNVVLEVLEAKDLRVGDINGYSDPYVKVGFGNQRGKTKVKWKTLNPTWNETLNFMIPSGQPPNTILLIVRDKDPIFDDKLGHCEVEISQYRDGKRHDFWLPLEKVKTGRIHLAITVTDNLTASQGSKEASNNNSITVAVHIPSVQHCPSLRFIDFFASIFFNSRLLFSAEPQLTQEFHKSVSCDMPLSPGKGPTQPPVASPNAKPEGLSSGISRNLTSSRKIETPPRLSDIEKSSTSGEEHSPMTSPQLKSPPSSTPMEAEAAGNSRGETTKFIDVGFGEIGAVKVCQFKNVGPCQRPAIAGTEHCEDISYSSEEE